MQKFHSPRPRLRPSLANARGFTLIELMVTVAVLAILAAVTFAGFQQDQYRNQYKRFADDVRGALMTARNAAIDDQTLVDVEVSGTEVRVLRLNQATNEWVLIERASLEGTREQLLAADEQVCIYGLISGVQTPRQATEVDPPEDCLDDTQVLRFESDGKFSDPEGTFATLDNVGATLWIANRKVEEDTQLAMIQVFPGGLIRSFDQTRVVDE